MSFSGFAWLLSKSLRGAGRALGTGLSRTSPDSSSLRLLRDRLLHLNEAFGYFLPSLTRVVSLLVVGENSFFFRPFTDDADKVSADYEPIVRGLLSPNTSEIIIDVGANIGRHTVWLSRRVGPSGLVIAIEPEYHNFKILDSNRQVNSLDNILLIRAALGSQKTKGRLVVPRPSLMGQTSFKTSSPPGRGYAFHVDIETLDDLVVNHHIRTVSAIKIDVEGAELPVLQGAEKTVRKFRPRLIIEVHGDNNVQAIRHLLKAFNMVVMSEARASTRSDEQRYFILAIPGGP